MGEIFVTTRFARVDFVVMTVIIGVGLLRLQRNSPLSIIGRAE